MSAAQQHANPINAVQEFYQRLHIPPNEIVYDIKQYCTDLPENAEQRFVCSVKLPAVVLEDQGVVRVVLESQMCQGEGRRKTDAKRDAAANALEFLQQQPLYRAQTHQQQPLQEVLDACFANQGILRDPELRAFWTYAQQYPLQTQAEQAALQQAAATQAAAEDAAMGWADAVATDETVQADAAHIPDANYAATAAAEAALAADRGIDVDWDHTIGGGSRKAPRQVLLPLTAFVHSKHLLNWLKQDHQMELERWRRQQQQQQEGARGSATAAATEPTGFAFGEAAGVERVADLDVHDVPAVMRQIRQLLKRHALAGKLLPGVSLEHHGLGMSRSEVLHVGGGHRDTLHHHVEATLDNEVWDDEPVAVMVPVDIRQPVAEYKLFVTPTEPSQSFQIPGLLQQISQHLTLDNPCQLVIWGRVGPRVSQAVSPEEWQKAEQKWNELHEQQPTVGSQDSAAAGKPGVGRFAGAADTMQQQQQQGQHQLARLQLPLQGATGGTEVGTHGAAAGTAGSGSAIMPPSGTAGKTSSGTPGSPVKSPRARLSGGTSVLVSSKHEREPQSSRQQQQQQHQGKPASQHPSSVFGGVRGDNGSVSNNGGVSGMTRLASAGSVQPPPLKRVHREEPAGPAAAATAEGSRQQRQQQQQQQQGGATASEAPVTAGGVGAPDGSTGGVNSVVTVVQKGGGPAAMDWEGVEGEKEVRGPSHPHRKLHALDPPLATVLPALSTSGPTAAAAALSGHIATLHSLDIPPPVMYSMFYEDQESEEAAGLNLRASWLAGQRVYGPVLLSGCGIMRGQSTQYVIKWRSFNAQAFWAGMTRVFPARGYSARHAPLLTRLPTTYRSSCWVGDSPKHLLERYMARQYAWAKTLLHIPDKPPFNPASSAATAAGRQAEGKGSNCEGLAGSGLERSVIVEDAAEAPTSGQRFNCRVRLRLYPVAAAAAAAADKGIVPGIIAGFPTDIKGLAFSVDTAAGAAAATAHMEVDETQKQLVVVADSGSALGPLEAENNAALAVLHLIQTLDAAALTGIPAVPPAPTAEAGARILSEPAAAALAAVAALPSGPSAAMAATPPAPPAAAAETDASVLPQPDAAAAVVAANAAAQAATSIGLSTEPMTAAAAVMAAAEAAAAIGLPPEAVIPAAQAAAAAAVAAPDIFMGQSQVASGPVVGEPTKNIVPMEVDVAAAAAAGPTATAAGAALAAEVSAGMAAVAVQTAAAAAAAVAAAAQALAAAPAEVTADNASVKVAAAAVQAAAAALQPPTAAGGEIEGFEVLWSGPEDSASILTSQAGLVAQVDAHLYLPEEVLTSVNPQDWRFSQSLTSSQGSNINDAGAQQLNQPSAGFSQPSLGLRHDPSNPNHYTLDVLQGHSLLLGGGYVVPPLEQIVMNLKVGGAAQARVLLPWEGHDVLNKFQPQPAILAVHLNDLHKPRASTVAEAAGQNSDPNGQTVIFDPSLSLQRRRLVSDLIKDRNAATVVDIGCGEGTLIKHLLCDCSFTSLKRVVGLDVSNKALATAARKLDNLNDQWLSVSEDSANDEVPGAVTAAAPPAVGTAATNASAAAAGRNGKNSTGGGTAAVAEPPLGCVEGEGSTLTDSTNSAAGTAAATAATTGRSRSLRGALSSGASFTGQQRSQIKGRVPFSMMRQLSITSPIKPTGANAAAAAVSPRFSESQSSKQHQQQLQQPNMSSGAAATATAYEQQPDGGFAWRAEVQLIQGDITHPGLISPAPWRQLGLNPGCDLAACVEILEHLEIQQVDAFGHSILGGLRPKTAVFTTPNWEYNKILRMISGPGVIWPGPPGPDGLPLRHKDHTFEWSRVQFKAWADGLAAQHGYSVQFVDIGRAICEEEVLKQGRADATKNVNKGNNNTPSNINNIAATGNVADDAGDELLAALPAVTSTASPDVAAAAAAVSAAIAAAEAPGSSTAAVSHPSTAAEAGAPPQTAAAGQAGDIAQLIRPDNGIGGATQAAIFTLVEQQRIGGHTPSAISTAESAGGTAHQQTPSAEQQQLLQMVWGPRVAEMRVGGIRGGEPGVLAGQVSGADMADEDIGQNGVPVERF